MEVNFFSEDISFELDNEAKYKTWVNKIASSHQSSIKSINYIFCSNEYLLKVNQDYLSHDYYTDVISFPYSEKPDPLEGDIFISVEMLTENAVKNNVGFDNELLRVMSHGILHFLGFKDKTKDESEIMRKKEDEMISLFS